MNIDLIAMVTMLTIMIMFAIGILLAIIIIESDKCTTPKEEIYEDKEQSKYLKDYQDKKIIRKRRFLLWIMKKLQLKQ